MCFGAETVSLRKSFMNLHALSFNRTGLFRCLIPNIGERLQTRFHLDLQKDNYSEFAFNPLLHMKNFAMEDLKNSERPPIVLPLSFKFRAPAHAACSQRCTSARC